MPKDQIGVQTVGTTYPRFLIATNHQTYWSGHDWITDRRKAVLYADIECVRDDLRKLKKKRGK